MYGSACLLFRVMCRHDLFIMRVFVKFLAGREIKVGGRANVDGAQGEVDYGAA